MKSAYNWDFTKIPLIDPQKNSPRLVDAFYEAREQFCRDMDLQHQRETTRAKLENRPVPKKLVWIQRNQRGKDNIFEYR